MRRSQDLPVDVPRRRISGRGVLIALGGIFAFVLIFGRAIARFYVDFLWHDALGRNDVFWGALGAKVTLFVGFFLVFAVLAGVNLFVADRYAPETFPANVHPYVERFHEVFGRRLRLVRYGIAALFALMLAAPAIARWQDWLLFRNSQSFGTTDDEFGRDVGFYVFELPFLTFLLDWMFAAMIIVLLLTIAAHVLNGGVVFVSPVPAIRHATKTHVAVLLALLAVLKAGDYWLDRFELTNAQTGIVQGATYSVVQARLPALMLLILIAGLTAALYLTVARTGSFRAPLIASALWLVVSIFGGFVYPAIIQGLIVNPDQEAREAPFIERNVNATRLAYDLAEVSVQEVEFDSLTATEVESDLDALDNARLLNPSAFENRFIFDEGREAGLTIRDLDVDRLELDSTSREGSEQVLVAALELDQGGLANTSWQGLRLISTHGCGLVVAPASSVQANRRPAYTVPELDRPELYFSPEVGSFAITNTESVEAACDEPVDYEGDLGVQMSSFARRASFALAFLDRNVLLSGAIESDSQMLWVRNINDRLEKLTPFLSFDADPYPVEVDGGVQWITDAYTTTTRYPYAESVGDVQLSPGSGLAPTDNYVRNSVKAVVDAYTGDVTLYVIDDDDPIIRAWMQIFPDLFTDFDEMPEELRDNLRYPEDLFRVQTDRYSKYRISAEDFFRREGAWSVAQAAPTSPGASTTVARTTTGQPTAAANTFSSEANVARFSPYYTFFDTGTGAGEEFVIYRPFVEFSADNQRTQLQAYMTASSEPDTYGDLISYVVTNEQLPDGPVRVASDAESEQEISRQITLDNQGDGGTSVEFGDLQPIPVADGLIYVRPYYVTQQTDSVIAPEVPDFRGVIVTYNQESVLAPTVGEALSVLLRGFDADTGDRTEATVDTDGDDAGLDVDVDDGDVIVLDENAEEVLARLDIVLAEADEALAAGDLGTYQEKVDEANGLIDDAVDRLGLFGADDAEAVDGDAVADGEADAGVDDEAVDETDG